MVHSRKEEILLATLELAAEKGLGNISTSRIADKVGIKKPSLYNHFSSKEEIVEEMYQYLRENAKKNTGNVSVDYEALFRGKTALDVLTVVMDNYQSMNQDKYMRMFYKVIYSERTREAVAAQIMVEETERMIHATKQLFYAFQIHGLLHFNNPDISALSFAMTVHSLMDYESDLLSQKSDNESENKANRLLLEYLQWFCKENAVPVDSCMEGGK